MSDWIIRVLRGVIAVALLGSVVVQVGVVAALASEDERTAIPIALAVIGVLGVLALQVVGVSVWRLLTMVGSGTVFTTGAFRHVDRIIGAVAAASVLVFGVAVVARFANHATPGDEVAPGLVGLICGIALVVAGVALVIYVMRALLAQAVARDGEARQLQSELDEVI